MESDLQEMSRVIQQLREENYRLNEEITRRVSSDSAV
jgi:hypothetical protein